MSRPLAWVALGTAALLAVGLLGGCVLGPKAPGRTAESPVVPQVKVGEPAVGTMPLKTFIPMTAVSFSDGIAAIGGQSTDDLATHEIPTVLRPGGGDVWRVERIGSAFRWVSGAAEIGPTRVVAGTGIPNRVPGKDEMPWVGVSENAGAYSITELGKSLFGGRSAEFRGIGPTGDQFEQGSVFMVVGGVEREPGVLVGNPSGTDPFAIVSKDGKTWAKAAELPLPDGVQGAEAMAITYAPHDTAYSGAIVVGVGWADTAKDMMGRQVGIVWRTTDAGKSWEIISDDNFFDDGRDFSPRLVAADDTTIVVAGSADAPGQIGSTVSPKQSESIEWCAGRDGVWHIISNGKSLRASRSGMTTALIARKKKGFIEADEIYDTATGPYAPGALVKSNPVGVVFASSDGRTWNLLDTIPGIDQAALVDGIAEFANRDVFFGIDQDGQSQAWVVDRSTVE